MTSFKEISLSEAGVAVLDCEHKTPLGIAEGFPYIAIPDIKNGRVVLETTRKISESDLIKWTQRNTPRGGDILITRRGRVGDSAPIPDGLQCAIGQNLVLLRSDNSCIDQKFLKWAVRSPQWWNEVNRLMNVGAIFSSLNVRDIGKIRLVIPDLRTQGEITEILEALENKIVSNNKLAKTLDQLASARVSQETSSGVTLCLSEIADITMGSSPTGDSLNEIGQGIIFYQGIRDFGIRYPEQRVWTEKPVRYAEELDTLLSVRAPVGTVNIASGKMSIGRGLASLRSRVGAPYTLFHVVKNSQVWNQFNSEGTVFGSINRKQLESVVLPWMESNKLEKFEVELASVEMLLHETIFMNRTLTAMRDALLPQLISGRLQVKEAEKIASNIL